MRKHFNIAAAALAVFAACLAPASARADVVYQVFFDTSAIASGETGYLDFQFNPGGPTADSATASISGFTSTNLAFNSSTPSGGGSGALPGTLTIDNSTPFNEVLENVTFGANSAFSFLLTFSGPAINNPSPGATDGTSFGVGVLDSGFNPFYDSSDPVLRLDIVPGSGVPSISVVVTPPVTSITPAGVPEPSGLVLGVLALGTLEALRRVATKSSTGGTA